MPESEMTRDTYVRMSVNSGIPPLELRYCQINDCHAKMPIAYRTGTMINSVLMGTLTEEHYETAAAYSEAGYHLAEWSIRQGIADIGAFAEAGRHIRWLSVRCPSAMAVKYDLYDFVGKLLEETHLQTPERLCLEFPNTLLLENEKKARLAMLNMKLLKVRTLMSGCAADNCPLARLANIPVDMVLLTPEVTSLAADRNRPGVVPSLIGYLRSMGTEVLAEGVTEDSQLDALGHADCIGYIASDIYLGSAKHGSKRMTCTEATEQTEDENGWQE